MKFKAYIFLCLLLAVLLISSTVVAEKTQDEKNSYCKFGCRDRTHYGCKRCCRTEEATEGKYQVAGDGYGGGYGGDWGGHGGGGGYGGGRGWGRGGGGWGGGGGGWGGGGGGRGGGGRGCQWGCCGRNNWGGCRCCYTAEEARAYMDNEVKP